MVGLLFFSTVSKRVATLLGASACLLVLAVGSVYLVRQQTAFHRTLALALDLPYARIDSKTIGSRAVYREYAAVKSLLMTDGASQREILDSVLNRIENEYITAAMAERYEIRISGALLHARSDDMLATIEPNADRSFISSRYFIEHILLPELQQEYITRELLTQNNKWQQFAWDLHDAIVRSADPVIAAREFTTGDITPIINSGVVLGAADTPSSLVSLLDAMSVGSTTPVLITDAGYFLYVLRQAFTEPERAWHVDEISVETALFSDAFEDFKETVPIKFYMKRDAFKL